MRLNHAHVGVTQMERSVDFYRRLGLKQIVADEGYARFELPDGDATFSLHLLEPGAPAPVPTGAVHFECDDLEDRVRALEADGFEFLMRPTDMPYLWREAILADPDGNQIYLYRAGENRLNPPWRLPD